MTDPSTLASPRRRARLFVPSGDARVRQASDVVALVVAAVVLALMALVSTPPSGVERGFEVFVATIADAVLPFARVASIALGAWSVVLLVALAVRSRFALARDVVVAAVGTGLVTAAAIWVGTGEWPSVPEWWDATAGDGAWSPAASLAMSVSVVVVTAPHLVLPARRIGWWCSALAVGGALLGGLVVPSGAVTLVAAAVASAASVHLVFGSSRGRPSLADVVLALEGLGIEASGFGPASRQTAGAFLVEATGADGTPLVVKIHGRDARDTRVLSAAWRAVWYREPAPSVALTRHRQVEHEALATLLAADTGVAGATVVAVGSTRRDDAVLVTAPHGRPVDGDPGGWTTARAVQAWATLARLHEARMSHGRIDGETVVVGADGVRLVGFDAARLSPPSHRYRADEAQLFVAAVLGLGVADAVAATCEALGPARVAAFVPYLQEAALNPSQRRAVRRSGVDLETARDALVEAAGLDAPELERMRRVTVGSAVQVVLLVVAFSVLVSAAGNLDWDQVGQALQGAVWALVVVGFLAAQLPRLAQSFSTLGASPVPLPLGPVYALQLASSYIALAVPSSAARIALNVRFFQRQSLGTGTALAVGALDGLFGFVVQAVLLVLIVVSSGSFDLDLEYSGGAASGLLEVLLVAMGAGLVAAVVVLALPGRRAVLLGWARELLGEVWATVRGLRSARRVTQLVLGNLGSEVLFATALGVFCAALGAPVGLVELLLINISVSLLSGLLPIPGGIGVVEGGLTFGLVTAGVPEETAFAIVLLYRLSTFYLPPTWGFFSLRWLERNRYL